MSLWVGATLSLALLSSYLYHNQQQLKKQISNNNKNNTNNTNTATATATAPPASTKSAPNSAALAAASRRTLPSSKQKMVLLIRADLGMGKGKIVAQACHGAVGVVGELMSGESDWGEGGKQRVQQWEERGAMKIALKVNSEQELFDYQKKCEGAGLPCYLVVDAGHTQIPENTPTVLAIGPAPVAQIDELTGDLKLM